MKKLMDIDFLALYPSWPKSSVNLDNFLRSSSLTVGLDVDNDFSMSLCNFKMVSLKFGLLC